MHNWHRAHHSGMFVGFDSPVDRHRRLLIDDDRLALLHLVAGDPQLGAVAADPDQVVAE